MGDELSSQSWIFEMFILDRIVRKLHSLKSLELKFGLGSEFFDKIPVTILLDVLFRVYRFSKASHLHCILSFRRHLGTETYESLRCQFCNFKLG